MNEHFRAQGPSVEELSPHPVRRLNAFAGISVWIFDLDNTLYPRHTDLFRQIDERIRDYVVRLLGMSPTQAMQVQKRLYETYGTTLRGLMTEHQVDVDEFLDYVHDIDHSAIEPDPVLARAIEMLPGRKLIYTNGTRRHAERVAERLGFTNHFEDIFGIVEAQLLPKPEEEAYRRFMNRFAVDPSHAAMFEDLQKNLMVPKRLGMTTTLVVPRGTREVFAEEDEERTADPDPVDFVTDDLGAFTAGIVKSLARVPAP